MWESVDHSGDETKTTVVQTSTPVTSEVCGPMTSSYLSLLTSSDWCTVTNDILSLLQTSTKVRHEPGVKVKDGTTF